MGFWYQARWSKACLSSAKGFSHIEGIDYKELFSPVVRYESVRIIFALIALEHWHMEVVDVKTAFLYGKLDKGIYMQQPEGFVEKGNEKRVYWLNCAIYRLKQAALAWWKELEALMKWLGFTHFHSDAGVFHHKRLNIVVIAHIYDCVFTGKDQSQILKVKNNLWRLGNAKT